MRQVLTAVLLLCGSLCHAQFGGVMQLMFGGAASAAGFSLPGLENRWRFTDMATNSFPMSSGWTDGISSVTVTNGTYQAPTNYALGAYFTLQAGLNITLTNETSFVVSSNCTTAIIFRPMAATDFDVLMEDNYNSGWRVRRYTGGYWRAGTSGTEVRCFNDPALDKDIDLVIVRTNADHITIFTNGVVTAYNNIAQTANIMPHRFGSLSGNANGLEGYIKEVLYSTNAWNSLSISNFHWYATNTYKYSP